VQESFRGTILWIWEEVYELKAVGTGGRKSEWWCTEMAVAVRENIDAFALWLQGKGQESREECKRKRRDAKTIIAECKRETNRR
jgi:hypothetical protein